ncbi:MAG: ORF6N domain-containing protein [Bacillus subtilis]|nr:ORF6N domain-containing protein [Bacillus subtilis]
MIDSDLAEMYGVETKKLVQAVKRNADRFPADFMFQLDNHEVISLGSQIVTSKTGRGGRRYPPYVFTEQEVAMLSSVLNSDRAVTGKHSDNEVFTAEARGSESPQIRTSLNGSTISKRNMMPSSRLFLMRFGN